tara:strand:- start:66 stop:2399 length:2334 start_codon:yes stop_codon:yes gene_type:complete
MYPALAASSFSLMRCVEIDNVLYLRGDLQIECYSWKSGHMWWVMGLCVPSLGVFVIGIPLGGLLILWSFRTSLYDRTHKKHRWAMVRYGLLYDGYKEDAWWFEVVVCTRKVGFVAMAMLTEGRMQVQIAVGFLALMLAIHICIQPYGLGTGANTSPNDVKTEEEPGKRRAMNMLPSTGSTGSTSTNSATLTNSSTLTTPRVNNQMNKVATNELSIPMHMNTNPMSTEKPTAVALRMSPKNRNSSPDRLAQLRGKPGNSDKSRRGTASSINSFNTERQEQKEQQQEIATDQIIGGRSSVTSFGSEIATDQISGGRSSMTSFGSHMGYLNDEHEHVNRRSSFVGSRSSLGKLSRGRSRGRSHASSYHDKEEARHDLEERQRQDKYDHRILHQMDLVSLLTSLILAWSGMLFILAEDDRIRIGSISNAKHSVAEELLGWIVVLSNMILFIWAGYAFVTRWVNEHARHMQFIVKQAKRMRVSVPKFQRKSLANFTNKMFERKSHRGGGLNSNVPTASPVKLSKEEDSKELFWSVNVSGDAGDVEMTGSPISKKATKKHQREKSLEALKLFTLQQNLQREKNQVLGLPAVSSPSPAKRLTLSDNEKIKKTFGQSLSNHATVEKLKEKKMKQREKKKTVEKINKEKKQEKLQGMKEKHKQQKIKEKKSNANDDPVVSRNSLNKDELKVGYELEMTQLYGGVEPENVHRDKDTGMLYVYDSITKMSRWLVELEDEKEECEIESKEKFSTAFDKSKNRYYKISKTGKSWMLPESWKSTSKVGEVV